MIPPNRGFGSTILTTTPFVRRVFFSFHYERDIWRANQVRQSWRYGHDKEREGVFRFHDASLWEKSKREPAESLRALIRDGIKNTSVTCVLAGSETFARRWVRYEIARSIVKGNGFLTVHIHGLKDRNGYLTSPGPNPLDFMGVYRVDDGRLLLAEKDTNGRWIAYKDYQIAVQLPAGWEQPTSKTPIALSRYGKVHDYTAHYGATNFSTWVSAAATGANR